MRPRKEAKAHPVGQKLFKAKYYDTYYLSNVVRNIAMDRLTYARDMEGFYEGSGSQFVKPFPKRSAFQHFIEYIVSFTLRDQTLKTHPADLLEEEKLYEFIPVEDQPNWRRLPINSAFDAHDLKHESFEDWLRDQGKSFDQSDEDDVYEYCNELLIAGPWEELVEQISDEIFFIMFLNRATLQAFNESMADQISKVLVNDVDEEDRRWLRKDGVLRRVETPSWAAKAVYHRDRGMCNFCHRDLTGLINLSNVDHCDHIVALAKGGLNDVTNLQLLCESCNSKKRQMRAEPSELYERWY